VVGVSKKKTTGEHGIDARRQFRETRNFEHLGRLECWPLALALARQLSISIWIAASWTRGIPSVVRPCLVDVPIPLPWRLGFEFDGAWEAF
jgi:hypothetical protein